MKQQRLTAYLKLIQELLTCPQGEEWLRLKHHEDLVDAEFLQVMEQVAIRLSQQGDHESATFLHNWAAKLRHVLAQDPQPAPAEANQSELYLALIQQLLECPDGMEAEILKANQTLIGPGLVHMMHQVAGQFIRQGEVETAQFLEGLAYQLNQQWLQSHDLPTGQLQKAPVQSSPIPTESPAPSARKSSAPLHFSSPPTTAPTPPASPPTQIEEDLGDPWMPEPEAAPDVAALFASPSDPVPVAELEPPAVEHTNAPIQAASSANDAAIAAGLQAIAQALQHLSHTLAEQRSPHPLWYLELLEQACNAGWQLTTEEVEQLIGVKPHCHKDETVFHRGHWGFSKVGKVGGQTAWVVSKETVAQPTAAP